MKKLLIASLALISLSAFSASECQGIMVVPSYTCINPDSGVDLRLSVMEFQTCENGKIVDLDRTESVINFSNNENQMDGENLEIVYQDSRSYYDRANRVDDLTFIKPVSVKATFGTKTITMALSNRLKPIFEGSPDLHIPGTFKILNKSGKVEKNGKLTCAIIH